jgi:hypothetical protein
MKVGKGESQKGRLFHTGAWGAGLFVLAATALGAATGVPAGDPAGTADYAPPNPGAKQAVVSVPRSLSARALAGSNRINWLPPETGENAEGYHIYRSLSGGGPYAMLETVSCAVTCEYSDRHVENGAWYYYVVRAFDAAMREGVSSPEVSVRADACAPSATLKSVVNGQHFSGNGPAGISGVAVDAVSGIAEVALGIQRHDTGEWWDGSAWSRKARAAYLPASVAGRGPGVKWTWDASRVTWSLATAYTVRIRARDAAGYELEPADTATIYMDAPAMLALNVAAVPGMVTMGQTVNVSVLVANTGGSEAVGVKAPEPEAAGDAHVRVVSSPDVMAIPALAPGEYATFSWTYSTTAAGAVTFSTVPVGVDALSGKPASASRGVSNSVLVRTPARLLVMVKPYPANVRQGMRFSIRMRVTNTGQSSAKVTSVKLVPADPGLVSSLEGPVPGTPFGLKGGETRELEWKAAATGAGTLAFAGAAFGYDETSGAVADSPETTSLPVGVASEPSAVQLSSSAGVAVTGSRVTVTAALRDARGIPVPGATVVFAALAGGARLEADFAVTDENGRASMPVIMPGEAGMSTVTARCRSVQASISIECILPGGTAQVLSRNFFDPSHGETVETRVHIPRNERVTVRVFNMEGEPVTTIADADSKAGNIGFTWDGRNSAGAVVPNGVYFFSVQAGSNMLSHRVIVLKR